MFIDSASVFQLRKIYSVSFRLSAIVLASVPVLLITSVMGQPSTSSTSVFAVMFPHTNRWASITQLRASCCPGDHLAAGEPNGFLLSRVAKRQENLVTK